MFFLGSCFPLESLVPVFPVQAASKRAADIIIIRCFFMLVELWRQRYEKLKNLRIIQAYEQGDQDIMKAEAGTVFALARVLGCSAEVICG